MKILFLIVSLLVSPFALANDQPIYDALDVEEFNPNPGMLGVITLVKEIGGLECAMTSVVYPNAEALYSCQLDAEYDGKLIYNALNVEAINPYPPGFVGSMTLIKAAGGLECTMSQVVYPGAKPFYSCVLN